MVTPSAKLEPHDSLPQLVALGRDTIRLALSGFQRYRPYLEEMKGLESAFQLDRSPVATEMEKLDRMIEWCSEQLKTNVPGDIYSMTYGSLRWLKAGILLATSDLKQERDAQFSKYSRLPISVVDAVNRKIADAENLAETGLFNGMKPVPLVFDSVVPAPVQVKVAALAQEDRTTPAIVMEMVLLDDELRRRCGDLFAQFASDPTHQDRFDTVLREASAIIESRIRSQAALPETLIGEPLLAKALNAESGELIFSGEEKERRSVHCLFIGFFGYVRNSVTHRLIAYTRERAAQILGLADQLLFLLSIARRRNPPPTVSGGI